jgi:hypothetical protein
LIFFIIRRKKGENQQITAHQQNNEGSSLNHNDVTAAKEPMMEVDWDKIEKIDPPHEFLSYDVIKPSNIDNTIFSPDVSLPVEKPDGSKSLE